MNFVEFLPKSNKALQLILEFIHPCDEVNLKGSSKSIREGISIYRQYTLCGLPVQVFSKNFSWAQNLPPFTFKNTMVMPSQTKQHFISQNLIKNEENCIQLYLRYSETKNWSLISNMTIPSRTALFPYFGEMIPTTEANRRELQQSKHCKMNYILRLREHINSVDGSPPYVLSTTIDAQYVGGIARFMNHSCNPNTRVTIRRNDESPVGIPVLTTHKVIHPNEELTFHYGGESGYVTHSPTEEKRTSKRTRIECRCGSANCMGYLPFSSLPCD